jgi:hypothetical protein
MIWDVSRLAGVFVFCRLFFVCVMTSACMHAGTVEYCLRNHNNRLQQSQEASNPCLL